MKGQTLKDMQLVRRILEIRETILKICNSRKEDRWALEVHRGIINCIDLVQEEAQYHDDFCTKFTCGKPEKVSSQQKTKRNIKK